MIAPFTKDRERWLELSCINACDGTRFSLALNQDLNSTKVVPQTFGYVLRLYPMHVESKSLAPDGTPCRDRTRGGLQRTTVVASERHFVGKETDRRWEHGEDLSVRQFKMMEYRPAGGMVAADRALRQRVAKSGKRALIRTTGLSQHTIEAICRGRRVRRTTLHRLLAALDRENA